VASSALSVLTLPAAPTNVSATVIDATNVRVTFTGDSNTGSTITYTVTSSPGSFTATGTSSPITVNATFTSGTSYTFTVAAKNTSTSNGGGTTTSVTPSGSVTPLPKPSVATIVTTSLVINLDSNKGISGSTWTDQTGNGYNYIFYTSSNTATNYTTTTSNGYTVITLDGTTNYFWNSSGFDSYFKGSFTYEMWVYPTSTRNATLIYENGQGSFGGWSDDQMGTNSSGYFTSYVYNGGSIVGTTGEAYSINNWYQVVNVYDNTAHILYQYVNGALIAQVSITKSYPSKVYLVLGSQAGNPNSYMNGLGYFQGYISQFRGYDVALSTSQVLTNYYAYLAYFNNYDGLTSATAAPSAAYLAATGNTANGVYWINLPTAGAKQIYCILDRAVDGGGWMMAMKATRGTTFQYSANYWTTNNTLYPAETNRNDGDAKFDTMNYYKASDIMALWPDLTTTGGSLYLTNASYSCWSWLQNKFTSAGTFYAGTGNNPSTTTVSGITTSMILIDWFKKISSVRYFIQDAKTWAGWGSRNMFSSQKDVRFYGFNYLNNGSQKTRWGFGWNENGNASDGAGPSLFPLAQMDSDDVFGGIGLADSSYSAGERKSCCEDYLGFDRSARVEIYIRDSANAPSAPTIGTVTVSGTTATIPFTGVTGASYYTAFSSTGGFYGSATGSPITISGLTTGKSYTFTVKASSALGTSAASSPASNSIST
jgi:hypothetical protein